MTLQNKPFDHAIREGWAVEYFQLNSAASQTRLAKYLNIPRVQRQLIESTDDAAKLSGLTLLVAAEAATWLEDMSRRLSQYEIQSDLLSTDTAAEVVLQFQTGTEHALHAWADPAQAAAHLETLLHYLQLQSVPCQSAQEAVLHAVFEASDSGPAHAKAERLAAFSSTFLQVRAVNDLCV